jgi:hypothetical protein
MGIRNRRSCPIERCSASSTLARVRLGRELRSARPARPSCSKRLSHFLAVRRLTPAASAAALSPITAIRPTNNFRPSTVNLAFL